MILRRAKVIDNNDLDKLDRIQLQILPELKDAPNNLLPWIYPMFGTTEGNSKRSIPEVDDYVYVIVLEDTWQVNNIRYIDKVFIKGFTSYTNFNDNIKDNITDLGTQTYPQPNIIEIFQDGSATIRNTETGEFCHYHNSGTYSMFDVDGNIINYLKDKKLQVYNDKLNLELLDTGDILLENEKVTVDLKNSGDVSVTNTKVTFEMKDAGAINLTTTGDITIDAGASNKVTLKALEAIIDATTNIKLGGTSATEYLVKGTTFELQMATLMTLLQTHIHTTTATIGATGVVGVIAPSVALATATNPVTGALSTTVTTK